LTDPQFHAPEHILVFPATGMLRFMFRPQESFDLSFFELLVTLTQLPFVALSHCANIGLVVQNNTQEELLTRSPPLYWVKPSFLNLFMKKLTLGCADHLR
jgi:hypothetical protein